MAVVYKEIGRLRFGARIVFHLAAMDVRDGSRLVRQRVWIENLKVWPELVLYLTLTVVFFFVFFFSKSDTVSRSEQSQYHHSGGDYGQSLQNRTQVVMNQNDIESPLKHPVLPRSLVAR